MKLADRTISAFGKIVTGDADLSPYRSGPELVSLFNEFGFNDTYSWGGGFPSRWAYTESKIKELNGTPAIRNLIAKVFDLREWIEYEKEPDGAIEYVNKYLKFDEYQLVRDRDFIRVQDLKGAVVKFENPYQGSPEVAHEAIEENIRKCEARIDQEDYSGAITNARSLLESVLLSLENELSEEPKQYDGDLTKLYRRVQKLMNLEPGRADESGSLKQILSGLNSIVNGLAGLRNKMSDSHVVTYRPSRHHAKLAVNAAKTVADFVIESKRYQAKRTRQKQE